MKHLFEEKNIEVHITSKEVISNNDSESVDNLEEDEEIKKMYWSRNIRRTAWKFWIQW